MMEKFTKPDINHLKYFINAGLIFSFLLLLITGLIKFPGFLHLLGVDYVLLPLSVVSAIHDWSGLAFLIFLLSHLGVNREWLRSFLGMKTGWLGGRLKVWHCFFLLFAALAAFLLLYFQNQFDPVKELASSQIREYRGEKLSSISDLRETSISGIQRIDVNDYRLRITGLVEDPQEYTYDEVLDFQKYAKVVELNCVVGWSAKILWEGVLLKDLFEEAKVKPEAKTAIFYAQDGFTTSLPLDFLIDNDIILADKINGVVLPPEKGFPFQLVAEQKWGYKWIKWLTQIELTDDVDYRGTYESAGYNQEGDITGPKLEQY